MCYDPIESVLPGEMHVLLMVSLLVLSAAGVGSTNTTQSDVGGLDDAGSQAIREMMAKLDQVLTQTQSCYYKYGSSNQCIDLISDRSVISQLCGHIANLESRLQQLSTEILTISGAISKSQTTGQDLAEIKADIATLKRSSIFSAYHQGQVPAYVTHIKVTHYSTTVNQGTGHKFDEHSGVFKTEIDGVYHFSLKISKNPEINLEAYLVVDDQNLANADDANDIDILTSLSAGQEVWVDVTTNNVPEAVEIRLTFSGFLVD
ncbi:uncharacterized protein LOC131949434 [Physella acuta]|uniref:uncharacterized protein LOC131949434 n=1 Tax=Physella acuta TaxID=109671 RepID=UPI0027DD4440|nr:uncharacterized protein LOC131949434 [Physella acuta]